jgi:dihydrolipoamide dehydrogenase
MMKEEYDLLVIGAGAAGSSAVTAVAKKDKRVALVERNLLGGTCLNYGCDPTKTLLHSADLLYQAQHANRYGLRIPNAAYEWKDLQEKVQQVIKHLRGGTLEEAQANLERQGIEFLHGEATFVSPYEVLIEGQSFFAKQIIIATGCETVVPPIKGLKDTGFITNVQAVALPALPHRMAIIGGGSIGIEFAQMFNRFGVGVSVLEHGPTILDKEDREIAWHLSKLLTGEGIRLETHTEIKQVQLDGASKKLTLRGGERAEEELIVDEILLAVGRRPFLESLHLEAAGVQANEKGVIVDDMLRTTVPHIWAAGDVASKYQFTHVASKQGELAARNAFAHEPQSFDDHVIPWVTFTSPALAHVGKTEEQLQEETVEYRVVRLSLRENERAIMMGETEGIVKLLVNAEDKIVGAHILASDGDNLLAPFVLAMQANIPISTIASTILPYPTLSEVVSQIANKLYQ